MKHRPACISCLCARRHVGFMLHHACHAPCSCLHAAPASRTPHARMCFHCLQERYTYGTTTKYSQSRFLAELTKAGRPLLKVLNKMPPEP